MTQKKFRLKLYGALLLGVMLLPILGMGIFSLYVRAHHTPPAPRAMTMTLSQCETFNPEPSHNTDLIGKPTYRTEFCEKLTDCETLTGTKGNAGPVLRMAVCEKNLELLYEKIITDTGH